MPTAEHNPASAHMFIINPLRLGGVDNLFRTHPRTEDRIRALLALEQEGGVGPAAAAPGGRALRQRATCGWAARAMGLTPPVILQAGVLKMAAAFPDPPFDVPGEPATGFDVELMRAVAGELGLELKVESFSGDGFEGIFAGLADGAYDVVASGATVTEHRQAMALFCRPYVRSGQSLVTNARRLPDLLSVDDLARTIARRAGRQYLRSPWHSGCRQRARWARSRPMPTTISCWRWMISRPAGSTLS